MGLAVLLMVEFVEDERGLAFEHPVTIEFLDEGAWREQADIDEEEILDEDAQLLEHGAGLFRAFGLAEGDLDLLSDSEELGASGTVGHYSFDDEIVRVRGTEVSPKVAATLVHELTHVLQDQHFDIGDRIEAVADEDTDEESLRVLVEGDADRIEDLWIESRSDREREALEEARAAESNTAGEALAELPASLVTFFASSYILGAGFIDVLEAADGTAAIDAAFDQPPGPEEHVFDPISFLQRDQESEVDPPDIDGEAIEDLDGDFGAVGWFLMLAERIDPVVALTATDGWGGDAFRAYRDGDRTCGALRFVGETPGGAITMEAALVDLGRGDAGGGRRHDRPRRRHGRCRLLRSRRGRGAARRRRPFAGDDLTPVDTIDPRRRRPGGRRHQRAGPLLLSGAHRQPRLRDPRDDRGDPGATDADPAGRGRAGRRLPLGPDSVSATGRGSAASCGPTSKP